MSGNPRWDRHDACLGRPPLEVALANEWGHQRLRRKRPTKPRLTNDRQGEWEVEA